MAFKIVILSCLVAVASAGLLPVEHYSYSNPVTYTTHAVQAAPIAYEAAITKYAAPVAYETPITKYAAPVAYETPITKYTAPVAYATPITKYAAPVTYEAPITKVAYSAPIAKVAVAPVEKVEVAHKAQYSYSYDVQDGHTGDSKSQYETRDGDIVHGSYSVVDPDGTKRTVEYTADPHNGFNAVVHKEPVAVKVTAAKIATPVSYTAVPVGHSERYQTAPVYQTGPVYKDAPVYQAYSSPKYYN